MHATCLCTYTAHMCSCDSQRERENKPSRGRAEAMVLTQNLPWCPEPDGFLPQDKSTMFGHQRLSQEMMTQPPPVLSASPSGLRMQVSVGAWSTNPYYQKCMSLGWGGPVLGCMVGGSSDKGSGFSCSCQHCGMHALPPVAPSAAALLHLRSSSRILIGRCVGNLSWDSPFPPPSTPALSPTLLDSSSRLCH